MPGRDKSYSGYIIYDWKENNARIRKSKPKKSQLGKNELCMDLSIDTHIPEPEIDDIAIEAEIPKVKVRQAIADIMDIDVDEDTGLPDPEDLLYGADNAAQLEESIDQVYNQYGYEEPMAMVRWLRTMLGHEAANLSRESVMSLIEEKLIEYRKKAGGE